MRKGADCLSKWVGESERQLRLLFDQVQYLLIFLKNYIFVKCLYLSFIFIYLNYPFDWNARLWNHCHVINFQ